MHKESVKEKWKEMASSKLITLKLLGFAVLRNLLPFSLNAYGYLFGTSSGIAAVISAVSPLVAALLELFIHKKRPNKMFVGGLLLGLLGVFIVFLDPIIRAAEHINTQMWIG